jgi:MFS family permease
MQITHTLPELGVSNDTHTNRNFRIKETFPALHHRNFRLFWTGQLISLIGTWMQTTGQDWLVLQLTHSAWILGIVGALQFLPIMLLSLFGGVLADRLPKRKVLLFTQSFAALQATIMLVLVFTGVIQLWHIFVLAALLGATNAIDMPTRQSFVAELAGRKDLPNAIALNSSAFNMARIVGPGIAGLIIAAIGEAPLFLLNAISFIPVLISLTLLNQSQLHAQLKRNSEPIVGGAVEAHGTRNSLSEGLSYVWKTPIVLLLILVVGVISLFGLNFNITIPLFAQQVLNAGAQGYGFLSSAFGIGALTSALWLALSNRKPDLNRLLIGTIAFGVFECLFALSHWYPLSLALVALVGFCLVSFSATANTILQTVTPNNLRGRIMSVYMLVLNGTTPLGNLLTGGIAHAFGASIAVLGGALISLIAAITGWIMRKPATKSFEEILR